MGLTEEINREFYIWGRDIFVPEADRRPLSPLIPSKKPIKYRTKEGLKNIIKYKKLYE